MQLRGVLAAIVAAGVLWGTGRGAGVAAPPGEEPTRYLAFQVFTGAPDPAVAIGGSGTGPLAPLPDKQAVGAFVRDLVVRIGATGDARTKLAFIEGPLAFDHSDAELQRLIAAAFEIAQAQGIAVGFHVDDSMFCARRKDLWGDPQNVEALDWEGTANTGRRIDWGPAPTKLPPQLCLNAKAVVAEVRRRATEVIGRAVRSGLDQLKAAGREELFAGVIVGWETQIGQDFDSGRAGGFRALANRGYGKGREPADPDRERVQVVQDFIDAWAEGIHAAGIDAGKIYSHVAFMPRRTYDEGKPGGTYAEVNHFALPEVAFGQAHQPGFSTYPQPWVFEQIGEELARHGSPHWASSEGTNLQLGAGAGESGMVMETYLGRMFNHGATLVNVFAWGIGGEAGKGSPFRVATEGEEALAAYRKFLQGERLVEAAYKPPAFLTTLPPKVRRIQAELGAWVQRTGRQAEVVPLMEKLDRLMKEQRFPEAEKVADELLALLDGK